MLRVVLRKRYLGTLGIGKKKSRSVGVMVLAQNVDEANGWKMDDGCEERHRFGTLNIKTINW